MTDYKDNYLDSLEECSLLDTKPLSNFLEYSYQETLKRISGFFRMVAQETRVNKDRITCIIVKSYMHYLWS